MYRLPWQWIVSIWKAHIDFEQICNYYDGNAPVWKFPETLVTSIGKFGAYWSSNFGKLRILQRPILEIRHSHPILSKPSFGDLRKRERMPRKAGEPSLSVILANRWQFGTSRIHTRLLEERKKSFQAEKSMHTIIILFMLFILFNCCFHYHLLLSILFF